jgi:3-deoxy-D-manno-octulosonic-acid transferase
MSLVSDIAYAAAALATSPLWGYRLWRTGKWRTDWRARFGYTDLAPNDRPTLLIHAVSVGEVNATRQLIDRLHRRHGPALRIVVSTTTDTGFAQATKLYSQTHTVVRFPLDFTRSVRRFLDAVRPAAVALVELEVWPTFVTECSTRGIPVAVINGRLSERSWRRYRLIAPLIRRSFGKLAAAAVQEPAYRERFIDLGVSADRVKIAGTMKWDTARIADDEPGSADLAREMGLDRSRKLIVCGSTGPGEEKQIAAVLEDLPAQLLFAPRKPERFDEAAAELGDVVRRTAHPAGSTREPDGHRLFLLDTLGELRKAYALADVVIVGRTLVPLGGSDMMEPVALGKPTVVGPHVENFRATVEALVAGRGLVQVATAGELRSAVARLLEGEEGPAMANRGRDVVRAQQGATERYAALLDGLLKLQPAAAPLESA